MELVSPYNINLSVAGISKDTAAGETALQYLNILDPLGLEYRGGREENGDIIMPFTFPAGVSLYNLIINQKEFAYPRDTVSLNFSVKTIDGANKQSARLELVPESASTRAVFNGSSLAFEGDYLENDNLPLELTDQLVWSKAIKDTTGLKSFYEDHKSDYKWGNRVDAVVITSQNAADVEKAYDLLKDGMSVENLETILVNEKPLDIKIKEKKYSKGENEFVDNAEWVKGIAPVSYDSNGKAGLVIINDLVGPEPKTLSEARGLITADYQNYLEKNWIKELREKYTVTVNEDVLSELK